MHRELTRLVQAYDTSLYKALCDSIARWSAAVWTTDAVMTRLAAAWRVAAQQTAGLTVGPTSWAPCVRQSLTTAWARDSDLVRAMQLSNGLLAKLQSLEAAKLRPQSSLTPVQTEVAATLAELQWDVSLLQCAEGDRGLVLPIVVHVPQGARFWLTPVRSRSRMASDMCIFAVSAEHQSGPCSTTGPVVVDVLEGRGDVTCGRSVQLTGRTILKHCRMEAQGYSVISVFSRDWRRLSQPPYGREHCATYMTGLLSGLYEALPALTLN